MAEIVPGKEAPDSKEKSRQEGGSRPGSGKAQGLHMLAARDYASKLAQPELHANMLAEIRKLGAGETDSQTEKTIGLLGQVTGEMATNDIKALSRASHSVEATDESLNIIKKKIMQSSENGIRALLVERKDRDPFVHSMITQRLDEHYKKDPAGWQSVKDFIDSI
jgi:hypothetical protein